MCDECTRNGAFSWLCMGVGLGTAVALLFAPMAGAQLRKEIEKAITSGLHVEI